VSARRGLSAIALLFPLAACSSGGGSNYPPLPPPGAVGGAGGTTTPTPDGMVTITFVAPMSGAMVTASTDLTVSVTVDDSGTDFIDSSSVKMTLVAPSSTAVLSSGQLVASSSAGNAYSGTLSIGALSTGSYTLSVSAQSSGGIKATQSITLSIQGGPILIVNSPAEGQPYNDSLTIEILVAPGANPPTAVLAGMPVTTLMKATTPNTMYDVYRATVWFGPPPTPPGAQPFPTLTGEQLLDVKETDGMSTTEVQRTFIIDTSGPSITNTTPAAGQMTGGPVLVSAKVTDPSGVLDSSVIAIIGDADGNPVFNLQLEPEGSGVYSALFDTLNLTQCPPPPKTGPCISFPTISFRASDSIGNQSSLGYNFYVDNIPPLADLDPPQLRQLRIGPNGVECSFLFDPLSLNTFRGDMPNDRCMVPQVFDLRARIDDQGNEPNGIKVVPVSGVDPDNTAIYILTDTTRPLIVDSDNDGNCDTINPLLIPTTGPLTQSDQVLKLRLAGVKPAGVADFRPDPSILTANPALECGEGSATMPPKVLCTVDGLQQPTIAIAAADGEPGVWTLEPINPATCLGSQLDTRANNIPDNQWICIAVQSADLNGNKAVSRVMRVYVQYDEQGGFCAAPPSSAGPPPPCMGTYDPSSKEDAVGTCNTLTFDPSDLYYIPPGG